MSGEKDRVEAYLQTVERLEPEITPIDLPAAAASMSISLKRIADSMEKFVQMLDEERRK